MRAASTMFFNAARVSGSPRVFSPRSGFTQIFPAGSTLQAFSSRSTISCVSGTPGGVDVIDSGADLVGVFSLFEGIEQLHLRAGGLDGEHVGIEGDDGVEEVVDSESRMWV